MTKKVQIQKEYLDHNYTELERTANDIAKELGCHYVTVCKCLKEYGIPIRADGIKKTYITKEFLENEYKTKGTQILAKELGMSQSAVMRRLRKFGIIRREQDSLKDLSGQPFGDWTVIELGPPKRYGNKNHVRWLCECKCGVKHLLSSRGLISGSSKGCPKCAKGKNLKDKHVNWKGCGDISGSTWNKIKLSATRRNIPLEISLDFAWELYLKQDRKCALTGWLIEFAKNCYGDNHGETTASLDRINSSKGYVEGNVQWVHKDVNKIKTNLEQSRFIEICQAVSEHTRYSYEQRELCVKADCGYFGKSFAALSGGG